MLRTFLYSAAALMLVATPLLAEAKYTIKATKNAPPKELKEPIRKLLDEQSVQMLDDKGGVYCEVWFRKDVPAMATAAQVKNGLTFRDNFKETTILGAIQFAQEGRDYRKQKIKAGVYTLRLGFQPMDGDHMGTAPNPEFCLLVPADDDKDAGTMEAKQLQEMSQKASGTSHPAVFLLSPVENAKDDMALTNKETGTWVLERKQPVSAGDQKASIGLGLTLIGASTAA